MPIPPLDGAGIVEGFFPKTLGKVYDQIREIPILQFVGLLVAWNVFPVMLVLRSALYLVHSG
jgi:Zn-dependent protease